MIFCNMEESQKNIELLIKKRGKELREKEINKTIVIDGLTNPILYENAPVRILFVLKEAYDTEGDNVESWNHTDYLRDSDFYILDKKDYPTHYVVSKISSGLLHNWLFSNPQYEKLWADDTTAPEILSDFQSIGWVNIGKFPAPGQSSTSSSRLHEVYNDWKDVLFAQIEVYDPDIIIFGGTFGVIEEDLDNSDNPFYGLEYLFKEGATKAYKDKKGRLLLSTYHPSQRTIQREKYVNSIIHLARRAEFRKNINK